MNYFFREKRLPFFEYFFWFSSTYLVYFYSREKESAQKSPSALRPAKNLRVTLSGVSPGAFWGSRSGSASKAETHVVAEDTSCVGDITCDTEESHSHDYLSTPTCATSITDLPTASPSPKESTHSGSYYFPSFSLDYYRRLPSLDLFGGGNGKTRPRTIPVKMAAPCVLPSTLHAGAMTADEGYNEGSNFAKMSPGEQTPGDFKTPDTVSSRGGETTTTVRTPTSTTPYLQQPSTSSQESKTFWGRFVGVCMNGTSAWSMLTKKNIDAGKIQDKTVAIDHYLALTRDPSVSRMANNSQFNWYKTRPWLMNWKNSFIASSSGPWKIPEGQSQHFCLPYGLLVDCLIGWRFTGIFAAKCKAWRNMVNICSNPVKDAFFSSFLRCIQGTKSL